MPTVADYGIATDSQFTLSSSAPGDFQEVKFNLPDLPDPNSRGIMAFNVIPQDVDGFSYKVTVNGSEVFNATYHHSGFFTIHEVIPKNLLKQTGNSIQFKALTSNTGSIKVGDIVFWYQHSV